MAQQHQQDLSLPDSTHGAGTSDLVAQPINSLQSGGLHSLSSSITPSSYPNAPQPIGPPSGTISHNQSSTSQASTPVHKTSTSDLGGVTVDPPVRPSYQPQQDLGASHSHTNGTAQHSAWGGLQGKPSSGVTVTSAMLPNVSLSQQAPFGGQNQHQQPQQNNLGPSLLSSLTGQSTGPSTSDARHSLGSLSTPSEAQARSSFDRGQFSGLTHTTPTADALQMQFGQVQLNGTDYGSGFGTGFGPSSSQSQSQGSAFGNPSSQHQSQGASFSQSQSQGGAFSQGQSQKQSQDAAVGSLEAELPSYLRQQHSQQPQQPQSQQAPRNSSEAATSTADALIQQHSRPGGHPADFNAPNASPGYTAFAQQPSRSAQPAGQPAPTSVSAGDCYPAQPQPHLLGSLLLHCTLLNPAGI